MDERRNEERKEFPYYMRLIDDQSRELIGHLVDISPGGFKMDSQKPLPLNKDIKFRLDLTSEIADKPSMVFTARSIWCRTDPLDPFIYNVGFQVIKISAADSEIFNRLVNKYGQEVVDKRKDKRKSNLW